MSEVLEPIADNLKSGSSSLGYDPDRILQRVAEKCQVDRERLVGRGERGLCARNVAMWMIWETGTKSLREIGELFGGLDYAAVAATDSSNTIQSRFDCCQKVEDHKVKCLDLTPDLRCDLTDDPDRPRKYPDQF